MIYLTLHNVVLKNDGFGQIGSDSGEDLSRVLQLMQRAGTLIRLPDLHALLRSCKEHANPILATSLLNYAESGKYALRHLRLLAE